MHFKDSLIFAVFFSGYIEMTQPYEIACNFGPLPEMER
jgi:hypothetical protein